MNLDLSFSLLSTDNSKISADDLKGQDGSISDVSFADLLSGELEEAEPASSGQQRQELAAAQGLGTAATKTSCKAEPLYSAKTASPAGTDDAANAQTGQDLPDPAAFMTAVVATPGQTTTDILAHGALPANQAAMVANSAAAEIQLPVAEDFAQLPASWLQMISQARDYQATVSAASATNTAPADNMATDQTLVDGEYLAAADLLMSVEGLTAPAQAMLELAADTGEVKVTEGEVVTAESTTKLTPPTAGTAVVTSALPANTMAMTEQTTATDPLEAGKSSVRSRLNHAVENNASQNNSAQNSASQNSADGNDAAPSNAAANSREQSAAQQGVTQQVSQLGTGQQLSAKGAAEAPGLKSAAEAVAILAEVDQQNAAQLLKQQAPQQSTQQAAQQAPQQATAQRLDVINEAGGKTVSGAVQAAAQLPAVQPQTDRTDLKSPLQPSLSATASGSDPQVPIPAAVPGSNAGARLFSTPVDSASAAALLASAETAATEQEHALTATDSAVKPGAEKTQSAASVPVSTATKNLQSASQIQLTQTAVTSPETDPTNPQPASPVIAAKTTQQSFVQYRKAVNAQQQAQQKQQLKAELAQPGQTSETMAQHSQPKPAEFNLPGLQPVNYPERPLLDPSSRPTERAATQGLVQPGAMTTASAAASPLLASRSSETTQPQQQPLALLEPNAAAMLKDRVMYQVNQKIQSAEIRLSPEDLGSVQVKVQLQQEQLSVQFVVQQQGAKEALEQQMPKLRELLAEQGLELSEGHVSQQQHSGADERPSGRAAGSQATAANNGVDDGQEVNFQQKPRKMSDRVVDYYA